MLSGIFALYEDQIGKFDWRRELIGYPIQTAFEEVKGPSEYITVHTNLGILASLSARDGKVKRTTLKLNRLTFFMYIQFSINLCTILDIKNLIFLSKIDFSFKNRKFCEK